MEQTSLSDPLENITQFKAALESGVPGIVPVKPRVFFEIVEQSFKVPLDLNLNIPSSGIGSITLLEGAILASLIRILNPARIFEFGTYLGYSTALFLKNSGEQCLVYSIDLGESGEKFSDSKNYTYGELRSDDKKNDDYLRYIQGVKGTYYLSTLKESEQSRLHLLQGDSTKLDIDKNKFATKFDYIFVDGGHDYETIESDTQKSLRMIGDGGVVVWHDFNSGIHSDVTQFVRNFSRNNQVFHVQNTMLALCFHGSALAHFSQCSEGAIR